MHSSLNPYGKSPLNSKSSLGYEETISAPKLKKDSFVCGEFSLADIHWMSCVNALEISGNDVVSSRPGMTEWYNAVKNHPSTSKEKVVPYDFLPTKEDVDSGKVRNVGINVV